MTTDRRAALVAARDAVETGDDAAFRRANRAVFSTPCQDMALQLCEEYARHAYKGSADAALALLAAVLPPAQAGGLWRWVVWVTPVAFAGNGDAGSEQAAKNAALAHWRDFLAAAGLQEVKT